MTKHESLTEALAAFQAAAPTLPKDATNPHFRSKFTPLDTIVEQVGPLLAEHGLAWSTLPTIVDGQPALRYRLAHVSGQELTDVMPLLLDKSNSQGLGSAITYARRYSITAVLNLVADEDDDGNRASAPPSAATEQQRRPAAAARAAQATERPASAKQRGLLNAKASEANLAPSDFADALLRATGSEPREFDSQDHAGQWVKRQLDRLPARLVDPVLAEIEKAMQGTLA